MEAQENVDSRNDSHKEVVLTIAMGVVAAASWLGLGWLLLWIIG